MPRIIPKSLLEDLLQLFYPNLCVACQHEAVSLKELFCVRCESKLPISDMFRFSQNESTSRLSGNVPFYSGASMFRFYPSGSVQKIIHTIKYKNGTDIAQRLGVRFGKMLQQSIYFRDVECIIPIPLHIRKLRSRGFNQSTHFAMGLAEVLNVSVDIKSVVRVKPTETQTSKTREERILNMDKAFQLKSPIKHNKILLVDDVLTTGSTLEECALTILRSAPDARLSFATIALAQ